MNDIVSYLTGSLELGAAERCGVILHNGDIVEIRNIHENPTKGFHMDPKGLLFVLSETVATWHSHPGADPTLSEDDMAGFRAWPQLVHHIIGIRNGEPAMTTYRVLDGGIVVKA